eukprot:12938166-Prorocentrum_lima.AAC.1
MLFVNTFFAKAPSALISYKEDKRHVSGPPFTRPTYETIDFILSPRRWRSSFVDVETSHYAPLTTDHYPLVFRVRSKLQRRSAPARVQWEFPTPNDSQVDAFN